MIKILLVDDVNNVPTMHMYKDLEFCIEQFKTTLPAFNYIIKNLPDGIIINMENRNIDSQMVYDRIRNMTVGKSIPVLLIGGENGSFDELLKNDLTSHTGEKCINDVVMQRLVKILEVKPQEKNKRILLVDDNPVVLDTVKMYLEAYYRVDALTSASLAIEYLETQTPDVIILDIAMPEIDGIELLKKIKEIPSCKHIPVIFQTGLATMEKVKECVSLGASGYIVKPVNKNILLEKIANAINIEKTKETILYIDNYLMAASNLEILLHKEYNVIGEEAGVLSLAIIEEKKIDYIFINIDNSALYLEKICEKAKRKQVPIVLITSKSSNEVVNKNIYDECKYVLRTPLVEEEVEDVLAKLSDF